MIAVAKIEEDASVAIGEVVYLYVLGASKCPDRVNCTIPWEVDGEEIFFGPCKKTLRRYLKTTVLDTKEEVPSHAMSHAIYVVGLNSLPSPKGPRKIVWAGRVSKVMTFARAHDLLTGPRYAKMLASKESPMNIEPVREPEGGRLLGYRFRPNGVHPKSWRNDLVTTMRRVTLDRDRDELLLKSGTDAAVGFRRDACFTAKNLFFAKGAGLTIDGELLGILEKAQRGISDIDPVAVFGRLSDGAADGLRGRYLTVSGDLARQLVVWLRKSGPRAQPRGTGNRPGPTPQPTVEVRDRTAGAAPPRGSRGCG